MINRKNILTFLFFVLGFCTIAQAEEQENRAVPVKAEEIFSPSNSVILGVVEGLTEYLPVSSTGHLILTNSVLGLDLDVPVIARGKEGEGKEVWVRDRDGSEFTAKEAADAYSIIIQFGAIIAVLFAFWKRCTGVFWGVLKGDAASWRLSRNLIIAFVPAAGLGFFFSDHIEEYLFHPVPVACALIVGGIIMLVVERIQRRKEPGRVSAEATLDLQDMSPRQSLTIGLMQCMALWPGMSRSMSTIVGGYIAGLSPRRATEFSFLLGLITLSAASIYKTLKCAPAMAETFGMGVSVIGLVVAFVAAFVSVKWLIEWISKHGLGAFAWYRFALAAIVLVWAYWN